MEKSFHGLRVPPPWLCATDASECGHFPYHAQLFLTIYCHILPSERAEVVRHPGHRGKLLVVVMTSRGAPTRPPGQAFLREFRIPEAP